MPTEKLEAGPLALRTDVVASVLEDGAVLLDLATKYFYSVNSTGWVILQLLENGATLEEIQIQCSVWGASDSEAISRFIQKLVDENLVAPPHDQVPKKNIMLNGNWAPPVLEKHREPLQRIMTNAFDPSIPLAE
jgi:Coenzyme PQQ synthesis protein D (PqqD)